MKQIDESIECFLNALDTATGRNRLTLKREQRVRKKKAKQAHETDAIPPRDRTAIEATSTVQLF